jgi:hypothetical protein
MVSLSERTGSNTVARSSGGKIEQAGGGLLVLGGRSGGVWTAFYSWSIDKIFEEMELQINLRCLRCLAGTNAAVEVAMSADLVLRLGGLDFVPRDEAALAALAISDLMAARAGCGDRKVPSPLRVC